jgi:hypothetical protein
MMRVFVHGAHLKQINHRTSVWSVLGAEFFKRSQDFLPLPSMSLGVLNALSRMGLGGVFVFADKGVWVQLLFSVKNLVSHAKIMK